MSYDNLRKGRFSIPEQVYSITTVTHNRVPLFNNFNLARLLVRELRRLHDNDRVTSLAWVIMPDHLHWLLQLNEHWPLSKVMKSVKANSALSINRQLDRRGSIWQKAYFDHAIRKHEDIRHIARYIVANPLRADLSRNIGDYPHWYCIWINETDYLTSMVE